jgi:RNA polymerase sigma-70 factor (ECF subfamily)
MDDIQLMRQIASRDQGALLTLYEQHGRAVYSLAYRVLQNTTLAEEVTQDTFLKVWQQTASWDPDKGKLKNWLLAIAHHTAIDRLRREKRHPVLHPDALEDTDETLLTPHNESGWQEGMALRLVMQELPDEQARLIDLAFFQGLTHTDIAAVTHIPLGTVKTRLRMGIKKLRELWLESVNKTSTRS